MSAPVVLLTGATGLIGRQTVGPLRAAGFHVLAASRAGGDVPGAEGVALDCLDRAAVRACLDRHRPSHLLHLAWHDGAKDRWTSPANLDWLGATLDLLRGFAASGGRRAVLVGSCAEYDWSLAARGPLAEDAPLRPATLYGAAKAATGIAAVAAAPALDLSLAWARPFFCYGPGEAEGRLFGDLIAGLRARRAVDCTDGLQRRDFLMTGDLGRALAALLASPVEGPVNVASGEAPEVREVIMAFAGAVGAADLVRLGARPRPADDPPLIRADIARLRGEVGFAPAHDLASGVAATLRAEGLIR
ncbi:NAD(P)-dependent oxidoreductase [Frigidibacter sp. RF13]|uniref:NAD-dependent epimerase/dehydratase family protein n=1 Tax=Frigidibacter sp. RF13 TaxID=2997340 RepID=UPI0022703324|nr:NAD(P)-dependent oxidoreductase [Frigidibacter sp. RF13]MCY1125275.1 NAD(P)-dependent oxidoreductase [Frigidibacter sp. RF13]